MNKKILIPIAILIIGCVILMAQLFHVETEPSIQNTSPFNRPNTEERIQEHADALSRIDSRWDHIHIGEKLESEGKYDEAIEEVMKSFDYSNKEDASAWVGRRTLQRIYEKAGYYDLAMKELAWAESVQTRPDVLNKLAEDRSRLEDLIQKSYNTGSGPRGKPNVDN